MLQRLQRRRAANQGGFTLIELLVVIVIIGILLAIAVPSYLGFRDRANTKASAANVRAAVPSVEAFFADNNTYAGMTPAALKLIDSGISPTLTVGPTLSDTVYCIQDSVGGKRATKTNPAGPVVQDAAAACT